MMHWFLKKWSHEYVLSNLHTFQIIIFSGSFKLFKKFQLMLDIMSLISENENLRNS